jgi:nicotinamidase-related amidase
MTMNHRTALLALHYQNEVLHRDGKIRLGVADDARRAGVIAAAGRLLAAARAGGVPVVHVRIAFRADFADVIQNCALFRNVVRSGACVEGSWGAAFHDGLGPLAGEYVIKHSRVNAFHGAPLDEALRLLDTRRLIVAGVATNSVVETTVRHAADVGYAIIVAQDACAASDPALHGASLANMALLAEVLDVEAVVARLGGLAAGGQWP